MLRFKGDDVSELLSGFFVGSAVDALPNSGVGGGGGYFALSCLDEGVVADFDVAALGGGGGLGAVFVALDDLAAALLALGLSSGGGLAELVGVVTRETGKGGGFFMVPLLLVSAFV